MQSFPFTSQITYDADGNIQYDRAVDSIIFRNVLKQYVTNGVFPNPSSNFQVVANNDTDMTVKVNLGACIINGATGYEDEDRILTVQAADALDRIDTVVLRLNDQMDYRNIDLYIHQGIPAATPTAPELTRGQDIYELGVANLYITANSTRITQERITDTRLDANRCGYAMFMSEIDTTSLYNQIQSDLATFKNTNEADFITWKAGREASFETWEIVTKEDVEAWVESVKDIISDSDVARIAALIQDARDDIDRHKAEVVASESGVHGIRYYDENLEYKNQETGEWEKITSGGGGGGGDYDIVSWSTGTDAQIVSLIEAASAGTVDLYNDCGWRVGDERTVQLSTMSAISVGESHNAEEVTFVITHFGGIQVVDDSEYKECILQVDMKNTLTTRGYMNDTNTNAGSWESSKRKAWCNNVFFYSLPASLKRIFKQFISVTALEYNDTKLKNSKDFFALRAEKEIFGTRTYSVEAEANALTQVDYYKTAANRIKKLGNNGNANWWWLRSPSSGLTPSFCGVGSLGDAGFIGASNADGLSAFGCIGSKPIKIVSWADGTDEEVASLVNASRLGYIDLYNDCGWRVGDKRIVSLSSMAAAGVGESHNPQSVELVLSHRGGYEYVNSVKSKDGSTRTTCAFQVDMVNCLLTRGYMNDTNTNAGSWESSKRRAWCNNVFFYSLPQGLQSAFGRAFKTVTATSYNGTTTQVSNDFFALRAEKEIFGTRTYSVEAEANALTQVDYYKTAANRIKKLGNNGNANWWWLRSPSSGLTPSFCGVGSLGDAGFSGASNADGLSVFGCIG